MSAATGLARLLQPTSVAIVGLSSDPSKHGARVLSSLRRFGFRGPVWGVNHKRPDVDGIEVFASLTHLPEAPDAIVVAVPAAAIPGVLRDAGAIGAGGAILFSGGFAEAGAPGAALQAEIRDLARIHGLRLLGPNSAGVINASADTVLSFLTCLERPADELRSGPVGLVTQSGGMSSYLHNLAAERGGGLAVSVSTGNEADVDAGEAMSFLVAHRQVQAVAVLLETVRDGPSFVAAARQALEAGKPVVVCKIGRSTIGQQVMRSHTGALAGPSRRYDAVFDALGITQTDTPAELFEVAQLMACSPLPAGDHVGIVTHSGGTAVLLADKAEAAGLTLPQPSGELADTLAPFLQLGAAGNPTDLGGIITEPRRYVEVVRRFAEDPAYDVVVAVSTPHPAGHSVMRAAGLAELRDALAKPLLNLWLAGDVGADGLRVLRAAQTPTTTEVGALVQTVKGLVRLGALQRDDGAHVDAPGPDPAVLTELRRRQRPDGPADLSEAEAKSLLTRLGVEVMAGGVAFTAAEAQSVAARIGYPVVLKVLSTGIAHKSDVGGVRLDLRDAQQVEDAWSGMTADVARLARGTVNEGVLVEEYAPGIEMIAGIVGDPVFGPMVLVGTGGTIAEALDDVCLGLPPISDAQARRMIASLRGRRLLQGFRGAPVADEGALAQFLVRLSGIALAYGDSIEELDINPLVYASGRWRAADALLRLRALK